MWIKREGERRGQYKDPSLKLLLWVPQGLNPWESPTKTTHASQCCPPKCWETEKFIQGSQPHWLMVSPGALASSSFRPYYWYLGEEALTPEKHMGRKVTDMLVLAWGEPELAQNCLLHLCLKSERSQGYVAQYIRIICDSHTVPRLLNLEMSPDNGIASSMPVTFMYSSACTQPKETEINDQGFRWFWHHFTWCVCPRVSVTWELQLLLPYEYFKAKKVIIMFQSTCSHTSGTQLRKRKSISMLEEENRCAVLFNIC